MKKNSGNNVEKSDKLLKLAILIAVFGLLFFIALSLTLPFNQD